LRVTPDDQDGESIALSVLHGLTRTRLRFLQAARNCRRELLVQQGLAGHFA